MGIIEKRHNDPDGQFDPTDNTYVKLKKTKRTEQSGQISIKKKSHNFNSKESVKKQNLKAADLNTISAITKTMNEDLSQVAISAPIIHINMRQSFAGQKTGRIHSRNYGGDSVYRSLDGGLIK